MKGCPADGYHYHSTGRGVEYVGPHDGEQVQGDIDLMRAGFAQGYRAARADDNDGYGWLGDGATGRTGDPDETVAPRRVLEGDGSWHYERRSVFVVQRFEDDLHVFATRDNAVAFAGNDALVTEVPLR